MVAGLMMSAAKAKTTEGTVRGNIVPGEKEAAVTLSAIRSIWLGPLQRKATAPYITYTIIAQRRRDYTPGRREQWGKASSGRGQSNKRPQKGWEPKHAEA